MDNEEAAKAARRQKRLFEAALTLLLDRAGSSLTFTEAEYQAVIDRRRSRANAGDGIAASRVGLPVWRIGY